jgi:hypothetical protein
MSLRLVSQSLIAVGVLVASMFVGIAPASAYTTRQAAWINDAIIAKAWFNSGAVNPDQQIRYRVCANFAGYSGCSPGTFDYRR